MQAWPNRSILVQPLMNPLTAAAAAAASAAAAGTSSGNAAPPAITALVWPYSQFLFYWSFSFYQKTFYSDPTNLYILGKILQNGDSRSLVDVKPRIADELLDKSKVWKLMEITESSQCRSLKLTDNMRTSKVILYPSCCNLQCNCLSGSIKLILCSTLLSNFLGWVLSSPFPTHLPLFPCTRFSNY